MKIILAASIMGGFALSGCDHAETGPGPFPSPTALREIVDAARELKIRHHASEAIERLDPLFRDGKLRAELSDGELAFELRSLYAALLLHLSRPRDALPLLEALSKESPADGSTTLSLAQARLALGQHAGALLAFETLSPRVREQQFIGYGKALLAAGRGDQGRAVLAAGLVRDPWAREPYLQLGLAPIASGSKADARVFLKRYREGEAYRAAEQKALTFEHGGKSAAALHIRALAERDRGHLFAAMVLDNRAIKLNAGFGLAYLDLARLTLFLERPQDAVDVLERLSRNPTVDEILSEARARLKQTGAPDEVDVIRLRVGREMRGLGLRKSVPHLLRLAEDLHRLGELEDARRLVLFLRGLAPGDSAVAAAVAPICAEPEDVFFRLSATSSLATADAREQFDADLAGLGVDPGLTRKYLGK